MGALGALGALIILGNWVHIGPTHFSLAVIVSL